VRSVDEHSRLFIPYGLRDGPGVDSASNRNKYQGYFLGSKGGQGIGLTILPPSCANSLEIGSLNFLEPSEPVQAYTGLALPFPFFLLILYRQMQKFPPKSQYF